MVCLKFGGGWIKVWNTYVNHDNVKTFKVYSSHKRVMPAAVYIGKFRVTDTRFFQYVLLWEASVRRPQLIVTYWQYSPLNGIFPCSKWVTCPSKEWFKLPIVSWLCPIFKKSRFSCATCLDMVLKCKVRLKGIGFVLSITLLTTGRAFLIPLFEWASAIHWERVNCKNMTIWKDSEILLLKATIHNMSMCVIYVLL